MTLVKGHMSAVCQHFQRASALQLLGQFHLNFMCSLLAKRGRKFGHMIKMVKTLKNLPVQNHWADCLETWYVASGVLVFKIYINDDTEWTLSYFMARSNLVPSAFEWKKLRKESYLADIVLFGTIMHSISTQMKF